MWISDYLLALCLTIVVEGLVVGLYTHWKRAALQAVVFIDLITHPVLMYFVWLNAYLAVLAPFSAALLLEMTVVLAEWRLLVYVFGKKLGRPLMLSFIMNLASYTAGVIALHS